MNTTHGTPRPGQTWLAEARRDMARPGEARQPITGVERRMKTVEKKEFEVLSEPGNGAEASISFSRPYSVEIDIEGVAALLCHRWQNESVEAKAKAAKNSAAKKTDDVNSYVYRCPDGTIGIAGTQLWSAIAGPAGGAKYRQDPRSPRKSALDLYKAGVVVLTEAASLGKTEWDYMDRRRVMVQRSGVTRERPAFVAGWTASFHLQVLLPEYIGPHDLHGVLVDTGRLVGLGDFRPTYGRFNVVRFEVLGDA